MKRGNLTRRTGIQAKTGLKSTKPLARSRLKPRSEKTQKRYKEERIPMVKRLLEERPWCEACSVLAEHEGVTFYRVKPSTDIHEIFPRGRAGGVNNDMWLQEDNVLAICRGCHDWITSHPADAEELGLLKSSY